MAIKHISHHVIPHSHPDPDGGKISHHRAHALGIGALVGYLIIFVLTVLGIYFIRTNAPQILGTATYTAAQIIKLTNIKRAEYGLNPLTFNPLLAQAAQSKSADMFGNNYWAHYSSQGKTPWSFISSAGYKYIYAGENLARDFSDAQSVVNAWMASPSHKNNLLDKNFKEIGVAVVDGKLDGKDGVLVVQMFGSAITQISTDQQLAQQDQLGESIEQKAVNEGGAQITQISSSQDTQATVLASRKFAVAKGISLVFISFIFILFALEILIASKKAHLKIKNSTVAHLGLLGLVLFAVWYAVGGAVI